MVLEGFQTHSQRVFGLLEKPIEALPVGAKLVGKYDM
jgi:hypothetical protein